MEREQDRDLLSTHSRITRLPHHTATRIVATSIIPDLQTAVLGLVKNSLDAGASSISVTINPARSSCEVQDNGYGISSREFGEDGSLCRPHHTSKHAVSQASEASSSDGIFLSSLASISLLRIVSKTSEDQHCSELTVHQGDLIKRGSQATEREDSGFQDCGTIVTADDIFGNVPVRLKHRHLADNARKHDAACWEDLKHKVVATLLAWRRPCVIKLRDISDSQRTVTLAPSHAATSHALTSSALNGGPQPYNLKHKLVLLSQAKLSATTSQNDWIALSASSTSAKIKGYICQKPSSNKSCQFISIGIHAVPQTEEAGMLYDTVNRVFGNSSFGSDDQVRQANGTEALSKDDAPSKGADRHPMFILAIDLLQTSVETRSGIVLRRSIAERLSPLIVKIVEKWLVSHGFRIRKTRTHARNARMNSQSSVQQFISSDSTTSEKTCASDLNSQQPHMQRTFQSSQVEEQAQFQLHDARPWTRIKSSRGPVRRESSATKTSTNILSTQWSVTKATSEPSVPSASPSSRHPLDICSLPSRQHEAYIKSLKDGECPHKSPDHDSTAYEATRHDACGTQHLPETLRGWRPPLLAPPLESAIPVSRPETEELKLERAHILETRYQRSESTAESIHKLSREDLKRAIVINQVDAKFILCQTPSDDGKLLFVIDQHAASERIILEELLQEYLPSRTSADIQAHPVATDRCSTVNTSHLEKPIIFETSYHEFDAFVDKTADFAAWGVLYDAISGDAPPHSSQASQIKWESQALRSSSRAHNTKEEHRIVVNALPSVIAERCRLAPRILIDLMRSEVWEITRHSYSTTDDSLSSPSTQPAWLTRINRCPKRILDLINSRACRSAVMFNDVLTKSDCIKLVGQLSRTVFPFMCAHGRTSVVPLYSHTAGDHPDWTRQQLQIQQQHCLDGVEKAEESGSSYATSFAAWLHRKAEA